MNERERAVAETLGAHLTLSSPAAQIWRRVAHGELSVDEGAARALAVRGVIGEDQGAEVERAKRVLTASTRQQREQRLEQLMVRLREDEAVVSLTSRSVPRGRKGWGVVAGLLALAAAAVLVLWLRPREPLPQAPFSGVYDVAVLVPADMRGPSARQKPTEVARLYVDDELRLRLQPEKDVTEPVGVVAFAVGAGEPRRLGLELTVEPNGFVEARATPRALGLHAGSWELVLAVGLEGQVPTSWEEVSENQPGYRVVRTRVEVVARDGAE